MFQISGAVFPSSLLSDKLSNCNYQVVAFERMLAPNSSSGDPDLRCDGEATLA